MINTRLHLFLVVFAFSATTSFGGNFGSSAEGTTTAEFLTLGVGARAGAMGEAASVATDDAFALYWNPAALTKTENISISLMHAAYLDSSNFSFGSIVKKFRFGALGWGYDHFSAGSIDQTNEAGATIGSFEPKDQAFTVGFGTMWRRWSLGISGKFVDTKILNSDSTLSMDAGLLSPLYFNDRFQWALVGRNLFGSIKYNDVSEDLPMDIRLGGQYSILPKWILCLDQVFQKAGKSVQAIGTEYKLAASQTLTLAGRLGYNTKWAEGKNGLAGYSMGLGAAYKTIALDYGLVPFGDLGTTHRFSLSMAF